MDTRQATQPSVAPPPPIQTQLAVGTAHNAFEREADQKAAGLMRQVRAASFTASPGARRNLQRRGHGSSPVTPLSRHDAEKASTAIPSDLRARIGRLRGHGFPLSDSDRNLFEALLEFHLGHVRIHTDTEAVQTAQALQARAYTVGSDIAFNRGEYRPGTDSGRRLLAHELIHVTQQQGAPILIQRQATGQPDMQDIQDEEMGTVIKEEGQWYVPPGDSVDGYRAFLQGVDSYYVLQHARANGIAIKRWDPVFIIVTPSHTEERDGRIVWLGGTIYAFRGNQRRTFPVTMQKQGELPPLGLYAMGPDIVRIFEDLRDKGESGHSYVRFTTGRVFDTYADEPDIIQRQQPQNWMSPDTISQLKQFTSGLTVEYLLIGFTEAGEGGVPEETKTAATSPPPWVQAQKRDVDKRIEAERRKKGPAAEVPDALWAWGKAETDQWYLNVWVHFDVKGQEKEVVAIPLKEDEALDKLLARVKRATAQGYLKHARKTAERATKEAPKWAQELKQQLVRRLERLRKKERKATDFPDYLSLDSSRHGKRSLEDIPGTVTTQLAAPSPIEEVYLQVWVHLTTRQHKLRREGGTLPQPLTPHMQAKDLIATVREAAALLRRKEIKVTASTGRAGEAKDRGGAAGGTATRRAYRGQIIPLDLQQSPEYLRDVTVTGAHNAFRMELDYADMQGDDLLGLALDMMRTVYFQWEIYDVSTVKGIPARGSVTWQERASRLRQKAQQEPAFFTKDAPLVSSPELQELAWAKFLKEQGGLIAVGDGRYVSRHGYYVPPNIAELLADKRLSDPRYVLQLDDIPDIDIVKEQRLRFPSEPGDYMVYCQATPKANVATNDVWAASRAFYPVRVRRITEVGKEAVGEGRRFARSLSTSMQQLENDLRTQSHKEAERWLIEIELEILNEQRGTLKAKAAQILPQATAAEVQRAQAMLRDLERLDKLLPSLVQQAEESRQQAAKKGKQPKTPLELLPDKTLQKLYFQLYYIERKTIATKRQELEAQLTELQRLGKRVGEFTHRLREDSVYMYRPEAVFVSQLDGRIYPLVIMLGEAPQGENEMGAYNKENRGITYNLIDVSSSQTQRVYSGRSSKDKNTPAAHHEAIRAAFENFGDKAAYGEGKFFVLFPPGLIGNSDALHPGTTIKRKDFHPNKDTTGVIHARDVKEFESAEGIVEKALKWLGYLAAVAGVAALIATGVGAPAAAALLGAIAAAGGAIVSIYNLADRAERNKLAWDAETALDIIGIISVLPVLQGLRAARATRYGIPTWYRGFEQSRRFLQIYGKVETGLTLFLVPTKLASDIHRIETDPELSDAQKDAMIKEAGLGAVQTGIMMLGAWATAPRVETIAVVQPKLTRAELAALEQQVVLLELEGFGAYSSLNDRQFLNAEGQWTEQARTFMRRADPTAPELPLAPERPPRRRIRPATAAEPIDAADTPAVSRQGPREPRRIQALGGRRGHPAAMSSTELTEFAQNVLRRPLRPMSTEVHFYETWDAYTAAFRARFPRHRPPTGGYYDRGTGHLHISPHGDMMTVLHETVHKVAYETFPWGPDLLGRFLNEGVTESIVRRRLGPHAGAHPYDRHVRFAEILQRRVGRSTVENVLLHGEYRTFRDAVHRALGGRETRTLEFLALLKRVMNQDRRINARALQRATQMLAQMERGGGRGLSPTEPGIVPRQRVDGNTAAPQPDIPADQPPLHGTGATTLGGRRGGSRVATGTEEATGAPPSRRPPPTPTPPGGSSARTPPRARRIRPLRRGSALDYHRAMDQRQYQTEDGRQLVRLTSRELYEAAWERATHKSAGEPPRYGFEDRLHDQIILHERPDIWDPGGQLRRSTDDPQTNTPRHYHAREHFGETTKLGQEQARYYAEANLRSDGIVDLDFRLRQQAGPAFRRSSRLRGQQEFNNALEHFRRHNGPDSIKGIRGDWSDGDNLALFNRSFQEQRTAGRSWDEAVEQAARRTRTGRWAGEAGFTQIRVERQSIDPNTGAFESVTVVFSPGPVQPARRPHGRSAPPPHPPSRRTSRRDPQQGRRRTRPEDRPTVTMPRVTEADRTSLRAMNSEIDRYLEQGVPILRPATADVQRAQEALKTRTGARPKEIQGEALIVLQQVVADARTYDRAKGKPLTSRILRGKCGGGRDFSAASLASLAMESGISVHIYRFQAEAVFGIKLLKHGFLVVTFQTKPPVRYLVDPTFGQFLKLPRARHEPYYTAQALRREAAGASLARDLIRDGFVPLNEQNASLYVRGLVGTYGQDTPLSPMRVQELGKRLLSGKYALTEEVIGRQVGKTAQKAHRGPIAREEDIPDLDIASMEEVLEVTRARIEEVKEARDPSGLATPLEEFAERLHRVLRRATAARKRH